MKNIIVIGISQSGLYDYVSLMDINYGREKGYGMLGGFFNSFGDVYRKEVRNTEATSVSQSSFTDGSHRRTFGLNRDGQLKAYRDYGSPLMVSESPAADLERRLSLLGEAKGHYLMALTTWDLIQISEKAPHLMGRIKSVLESSDVVVLKPDDMENTVASYLLANETGGWVVPKTGQPINLSGKFSVKPEQLNSFAKEVKALNEISNLTINAKVMNVDKALAGTDIMSISGRKALESATFGRPIYSKKAISYFQDANKIKDFIRNIS